VAVSLLDDDNSRAHVNLHFVMAMVVVPMAPALVGVGCGRQQKSPGDQGDDQHRESAFHLLSSK
jgi:hypothetical protein